MNIIDLAHEIGLLPRRTSSTHGGEYHSPCPTCGGKDRFFMHPNRKMKKCIGSYQCRQCGARGDAIQFCRDFMGMDYHAASVKVGVQADGYRGSHYNQNTRLQFTPKFAEIPSEQWRSRARDVVLECHQSLKKDPYAVQLVAKRGLSLATIEKYLLGWWSPRDSQKQFQHYSDWNLLPQLNDKGREKKLWLPRGIIIPSFIEQDVVKLKVRRSDWKDTDELPKYVEISGSMKCPAVYGNMKMGAIVIVESELDAMLVQQLAGDLCCCMAIGGAGKKPDLDTDRLLRRAKRLLFALDFDEAGKNAYKFWQSTYPSIEPWPVPKGKSPGHAYELGVNLREWVIAGTR